MKTYFKDFSISSSSLVMGDSDFEEVISNRQEKFSQTVEYKEAQGRFQEILDKLVELSPKAKKIAGDLQDAASGLECRCYSAAYRDGISDLMAAMTFSKIGLTNIEYCDLSSGAQTQERGADG